MKECGVREVGITDNLYTKQENSSIFEPKIQGLESRAVSNQERVIKVPVWYRSSINII